MADFERWMDGLPSGSATSNAIDVVAGLTEQAERIAGNGESELAMSRALGATFAYMVAYLHHLTVDRREPRDALAKAAAGLPELGTAELDFLHAAFRTLVPRTM
jgi:hypothetical protein